MTSPAPRDPFLLLSRRTGLAVAACLILGTLLVSGFVVAVRSGAAERERPIQVRDRVRSEKGEIVVNVDSDEQRRGGLVVAPIEAAHQRSETRAYGTVLDVRELADLYNAYSAAAAQARKSRASLNASRPEYDRLKTLHEDQEIVSTQVFQAAEAAFRSDEANVEAAEALLRSVTAKVEQDWGPVIGRWMTEGSASFGRILTRKDVLVQVTLPPDEHFSSPPTQVTLFAAAGRGVTAKVVSSAPRTDARIQGLSFFCITDARASLVPGMNVTALLPVGRDLTGVIVPESAVVWAQGKAWVFEQTGPTVFTRRPISTAAKADGGGYLVNNVPVGTYLVVHGAQALLSEESRSQTASGGEQDP